MKRNYLTSAGAHLSMNVAQQAALSKAADKAADETATVPLPAKKRRRRAKVTGQLQHKPSGSKPVPGGGNRQRERNLARMAAAAEKRQAEREAARAEKDQG